MAMPAHQQVLQNGRLFEQLDILERARNTEFRHLIRGIGQEVVAVKADLALCRIIKARNQVKDSRLARTVWTDQGKDFTSFDAERHVIDRDKAAKPQRDIFDLKQAHWIRSVLR